MEDKILIKNGKKLKLIVMHPLGFIAFIKYDVPPIYVIEDQHGVLITSRRFQIVNDYFHAHDKEVWE